MTESSHASLEPAVAPQKTVRRLHPLTVLLRGWVLLLAIVFPILKDALRDIDRVVNPKLWAEIGFEKIALFLAIAFTLFGVAGFCIWWFTSFIIDDEEICIETGFVNNKKSKQIAVDRIQSVDVIQSLIPRLFGLAEVKIDVGADSATRLQYVKRSEAYAMRDQLLAIAHGHRKSVPSAAAATSVLQHLDDRSADETVIATAKPQTLLLSAVFSLEFLIALAFLIGILITVIITHKIFAIAITIPAFIGAASVIYNRLFGQFNYRIAVGDRGVKVSRGLFDLTSQSIPIHRIQGIAIKQPLLWRCLGIYRMDVDVLGYGIAHDEDDKGTSAILMPAGSISDVIAILRVCLPELDLGSIQLRSISPKGKWFHPFGWKTHTFGVSAKHLVVQAGPWSRRIYVVPHARIQSVSVRQ
ncbi:MAG: PH domain-containing protein [Propionibacteriaceae bacterium]